MSVNPNPRITPGDLDDPRVRELIATHLHHSRAQTAPGSAHALPIDALRSPDVTFWTLWDGDELLGMGALKRLSAEHGEIKSMHTRQSRRRQGLGALMLRHLIGEARGAGLSRLSLETGSWPYFLPAQTLYKAHGFTECPPFGDYVPDPNSVFLTLDLGRR